MVGLKKRGVITAVAGILAAVTITGCSAAPDNDATVVTVEQRRFRMVLLIFMRVCSRRSMSRFMQA